MTSHTSEKKSTGIGSLILAACLLLFALLPIADLAPIGGSTEAREAHVARAIYQSGEFILPLRNGIIPSKPPLYHWLAAGAAHALGSFDELAARLPSLIFGALLVGLVMMRAYSISQRYCNGVEPKDTAILAASSLTLLYGFSSLMLDCRVDMTMAFFVVSALLYLLGRLEGQQPVTAPSLGQWVVFFSLCGFATLAKGPLGVVLPCLIAVVVLSFSLGFKTVIENCPKAIPGLLIFLSIAVPWYVLAAAKGQESFIGRQLVFENLLRFVGGENVNSEPAWFYLGTLARAAAPWSLLFVFFLWREFGVSRVWRFAPNSASQQSSRIRLRYPTWVATGVLLFTLSSGKRHSYLLPLYPALAIYIALSWAEWYPSLSGVWQQRIKKLLRGGLWVSVSLSSIALLALAMLMDQGLVSSLLEAEIRARPVWKFIIDFLSANCARVAYVFLLAAVLGLMGLSLGRGGKIAAPAAWLGLSLFLIGSIAAGNGIKSGLKDFEGAAAQINALTEGHGELVAIKPRFDELLDPLLYYLDRSVRLEESIENLAAISGEYVIARETALDSLLGKLSSDYAIAILAKFTQIPDIASAQGNNVKGRGRDIILVKVASRERS